MNRKITNQDPEQEFFTPARRIVDSFAQQRIEEPPPPIIYHYTDGAGLRGILESGKLWLTDIFELNDPSEIEHGLKPAVEILKKKAETGPPELRKFSEGFKEMVDAKSMLAHYFVFCFSKDGNDLGQWRAYADNGRGYAIGFDGDMLVRTFKKNNHDNNKLTFLIKYCNDQRDDIAKKIIDLLIPQNNNLVIKYSNDRRLDAYFALSILYSALFFKHEAYRNEEEYRFLQVYPQNHSSDFSDFKYRVRRYSFVRYIEFDWRTDAAESLKEIIIGPAADQELARRFAVECLKEFQNRLDCVKIDDVKINQSEIPYRAL